MDEVDDLVDVPEGDVSAQSELSPALRRLSGLAARPDGVMAIYDIEAFVRKMEQLYTVLHEQQQAARRSHLARVDLAFLTSVFFLLVSTLFESLAHLYGQTTVDRTI